MWVIFTKADKKVVGTTADTDIDLPKDQAIAEVVSGLVTKGDLKDYDAVQVKDRGRTQKIFESLAKGTARIEEKTGGLDVGDEEPEKALLTITVEGFQETHPIDGVPLIPANGQSFVTIRLQKIDTKGKPLTRKTVDKDVLWLRTDNGFLREDMKGRSGPAQEIRSVSLASGAASFCLFSEAAKRLATVQILGTTPEMSGTVRVEFT